MEGVNLQDQQVIQSNASSLVLVSSQEVNVVKENAGKHELAVRSGETWAVNESGMGNSYPLMLHTLKDHPLNLVLWG